MKIRQVLPNLYGVVKKMPPKSIKLSLLGNGIMIIGGSRSLFGAHPTHWFGWVAYALWAVSWTLLWCVFSMYGCALWEWRRKAKLVAGQLDELRVWRARLVEEHTRFTPDFQRAKAMLEQAPFDDYLCGHFREVANHLQSIEGSIRSIDATIIMARRRLNNEEV